MHKSPIVCWIGHFFTIKTRAVVSHEQYKNKNHLYELVFLNTTKQKIFPYLSQQQLAEAEALSAKI